MDIRVLAFVLAMSLMAGLLAGVLPAMRLSGISLREMTSSGSRTSVRGGRNLAGASLVSFEIAAALVLLAGAALLIRSFQSVIGRDIGFDTNVATVEGALSGERYAEDAARIGKKWEGSANCEMIVESMTAVFSPFAIRTSQFLRTSLALSPNLFPTSAPSAAS